MESGLNIFFKNSASSSTAHKAYFSIYNAKLVQKSDIIQ